MAKLIIHQNERSTMHEILEDSLLVGGRQGATIRVSDPGVSEDHCQIRLVPGVGYKLIDLESRDGTKVNGSFVNQHLLRDGDVIQLGAVRIHFTDQDGPPPAAAPTPAPAVAAAYAAPARPVVPPAQARPAPARPLPPADRDPGYPRRRRGGSGAEPAVVLGVVIAVLALVIVAIVVVVAGSGPKGNEKIYEDMLALVRAGNTEAALALAAKANPNGDKKAYAKILNEAESIRSLKSASQGIGAEYAALKAYQQVETYAARNRTDAAGIIERWEAVVRDHPDTHWAFQAQRNIDTLLGDVPAGPGPGSGPPVPAGGGKIDRAFRVAVASAREMAGEDQFQNAADALWKFWDEFQFHAEDAEGWKRRVEAEVKAFLDQADKRFEVLDGIAKNHVDAGRYDAAIRLYRRIAERFGIEKYQYRAGEAMRKLQRD